MLPHDRRREINQMLGNAPADKGLQPSQCPMRHRLPADDYGAAAGTTGFTGCTDAWTGCGVHLSWNSPLALLS